jgi:probable HAF family extracellular repeat protein
VLWNRGQISEIPNIGGDKWNTPMAINQHGDIAGFLGQPGDDPDNPRLRAFLWTRERGTQNLGTLPGDDYSEARGLNERRQVVGVSCVDPSLTSCRAFLWENGVMFDLNELATRPDGAVLINGQDINDAGVITGRALVAGPPAVRYAFVAIPGPRLAVENATNPADVRQAGQRVTLPRDVAQDLRSPMGPLPGSRLSRP